MHSMVDNNGGAPLETVTVTRRFSRAQAEKRAEAKRAAAKLASDGGYEAVDDDRP